MMKEKKLKIEEQARFALLNNLIASEVKVGRTLFEVSSDMANEDKSFKDVIGSIVEHQINKKSISI